MDQDIFIELRSTEIEAALNKKTAAPSVHGKNIAFPASMSKEKELLSKLRSSGRPLILLADSEYEALMLGQVASLDASILSGGEQHMRKRQVRAIDHALAKAHEESVPVRYVFAPEKLREIENIVSHDALASLLWNGAKRNGIPIVPFEVINPEIYAANNYKGINHGTYVVGDDIDYIKICTNIGSAADMAVTGAHEARHQWHRSAIEEEVRGFSVLDLIIGRVVLEAETHAVQDKIGWSFRRAGLTLSVHSGGDDFEDYFRFASASLTSPSAKQIKNAMQNRFLHFVSYELSEPSYLADGFMQCRGMPGFSEALSPARIPSLLEKSPFLQPVFLEKLSRIDSEEPYLDEFAAERLQGFFKLRLPKALAALSAVSAKI